MRKFTILYRILFVTCFINSYTAHAFENVFIHHLTNGDEVASICTDKIGQIWIGTDHGLTRIGDYKGSWSSPKIIDESINDIFCAEDGRLWILTKANEYIIYDPRSGVILNDVSDILKQNDINVDLNYQVLSDGPNFWIYSNNTVYCIDQNLNKQLFQPIELDFKIKSMVIGDKLNYVIGEQNLIAIDARSGKVCKNVDIPTPITSNINSAIEDKDGNIWIMAVKVLRYDTANDSWSIVDNGPIVGNIVSQNNGNIAVASNVYGLNIYNTKGELLEQLRHNPFDKNSLLSNRINYIEEQPNGTLLICYSRQGISELNSQTSELYSIKHIDPLIHEGKKDDICSIWEDSKGNLWIGTESEGVYCWKGNEPNSTIKADLPLTVEHSAIISIYADSRGTLWLGSYLNGLFRKPENGKLEQIMSDITIHGIDEDHLGNIYVVTQKDGVFRIKDGQTNVEKVDFFKSWLTDITIGRSSQIILATTEGLGIIDANTLKYKQIKSVKDGKCELSHRRLTSAFRDSRGLIWVTCAQSNNVLNAIDIEHDTIYKFPELDAFDVQKVCEDDNKTLWVLSEQKFINILSSFDQKNACYIFNNRYFTPTQDDQQRLFNPRAIAKDHNGFIYQGTNNGIIKINPTNLIKYSIEHQYTAPYLASLTINDETIVPGSTYNNRMILAQDIAYTEYLELKHDENTIRIGLHNNFYSNDNNIRYYYRIDKRKAEWQAIFRDEISLPNMSPGNYLLEIGVPQDDGSILLTDKNLRIKILPPFWLSIWAYIIYVLTFVAIGIQVTVSIRNRIKRRTAIHKLKQEAERQNLINNMKLNFFTNVSHDFRTPLSLIISPIEELLAKEKDEDKRYTLNVIQRNANRLQSLVNQILDLRKLESNAETLSLSSDNIVHFIKDQCADFILMAKEHKIKFEFKASCSSIQLQYDVEKLSKVLSNLISNAFKYTEDGGIISVNVDEGDNDVTITVSDTGCGIDDNEKEKIFDLFFQASNTIVNKNLGGSGVGLHIVKTLVELHGGTVSVADNEPKGSKFIISLPKLNDNSNNSSDDLKSIAEDAFANSKETSGHNILVVEDNLDLRTYLQHTLSKDYNVYSAANGLEAIEQLRSNDIDIIVSDVMMDKMDGLELCRYVRSDIQMSHIPIILLTAKALPKDEIAGLQLGADDYITKPFNISILLLRIKNILERREQNFKKFATIPEINVNDISDSTIDQKFLEKAIKIVEDNIADADFSIESFSAQMCMHRTNLYKKITALTGKTPIEFVRTIRLKKAYQLLSQGGAKVAETAYSVGFNSPKLFSRYFKEEFGISPSEVKIQ